MGFFERLRQGEIGGRGPSPFEPWPGAPVIQPIAAGRGVALGALPRAAEGHDDPRKYGPALVIGLGRTGDYVLRALAAELALDPAGPQQLLQLALLTTQAHQTSTEPLAAVSLRQFDLGGVPPVAADAGGQPRSARSSLLERFLHPDSYDTIAAYFGGVQRTLRAEAKADQETRVIVVGGLAEPEIGLLGNLMLLLTTSGGRGIAQRLVLLGIDSAAPQLAAAEQLAALRELGRLTFLGPHVMPHRASQPEHAAAHALIDYLLLVQNAGGLSRSVEPGPGNLPFEQGVGQALTEVAYALLHPAGGRLWEALQNDLNPTGAARQRTHAAYVYGAGVATLFVPIIELQAYIAARLAQAAVFGERPNTPEGLLARRPTTTVYGAAGSTLVRDWLQNGPLAHRLMSGLLDATGPDSLRRPPPLGNDLADFVHLLPAQVAHGLAALLNDGRPDPFERAEAGLAQLWDDLEKWANWCRAAGPRETSEHRDLLYVLQEWRSQISDLRRQLGEWRVALGAADPAGPPTFAAGSPNPLLSDASPSRPGAPSPLPSALAPPPLLGGPPPLSGATGSRAMVPTRSAGPARLPTLRELLKLERGRAEKNLQAIVGGAARRPLTAEQADNQFDGLGEAERYYSDTIRPELEQFLSEPSAAFRAVAQRLYWWIRLTRSAPPEVLLICLPVDASLPAGALLPPETAVFRPRDGEKLTRALLDVAAIQAQKTAENLTASWMLGRLQTSDSRHFLRHAEDVYLAFDAELARQQHLDALGIRPYLIGPNDATLDAVAGRVFPAIANAVERIPRGEPTRLSALLVRTDIPLNAVRPALPTQTTYGQSSGLYLYAQERLAAFYENQLRAGRRSHFPPDFVVVLIERELIHLFCQGLLAGLIAVRRPLDVVSGPPSWTVPFNPGLAWTDGALPWAGDAATRPLSLAEILEEAGDSRPDHEQLVLAIHDTAREWQSLWAAMRAFALGLPYGESLDAQPIHPFHRANRSAFLSALRQTINQARDVPEGEAAMKRRQAALHTRIQRWRQNAAGDPLADAFFTVLEIETQRLGAQELDKRRSGDSAATR